MIYTQSPGAGQDDIYTCNWKSTILRQRDTVPIVYRPYAQNDAKIQEQERQG